MPLARTRRDDSQPGSGTVRTGWLARGKRAADARRNVARRMTSKAAKLALACVVCLALITIVVLVAERLLGR